jgi:hypothetical protein
LALPPFAPSWETLEDAWSLPDATRVLGSSHTLASDIDNKTLAPVEEVANCTLQEAKTRAVRI